jgi:putative tricarboxylic transport membrane protein
MDTFQQLANGFATALTPANLLYAIIGCFLGNLIGVLPGIGPAGGMAMLLPVTFHIPTAGAIIMLAGIYYGSQYGGTITSVLMNIPGEASTVVTCFDGFPMAKQGRAGVALSIAAIGSFIGGTVATIGLVVAAPPMVGIALKFGPVEQFALMTFGLSFVIALAGRSVVMALIMAVFGLMLGVVGMDPTAGMPRFTFGLADLLSGLDLVAVVMGLFGVADILESLDKTVRPVIHAQMSSLVPTRQDIRDSSWPVVRGTVIGFALGLIPGMAQALATFISYAVEKKISKHPEKFGTGAIEGVAGPETSNNAFANASLIPLFTLGLPTSVIIAVLMGAFLMHGVIPGPLLFREHPEIIWPVIASLYLGNVILLVLNLPLIGLWTMILRVPYSILFVAILIFTAVGAYSVTGTAFGVGVMVLFGAVGYVLRKLDFPLAPVMLTFILGPMMERALRASLQLSQGDLSIMWGSPIAKVLLAMAALVLLSSAVKLVPSSARAYTGES